MSICCNTQKVLFANGSVYHKQRGREDTCWRPSPHKCPHTSQRILTCAGLKTKGSILWGTQTYPVRFSSKAICSMMFSLVPNTLWKTTDLTCIFLWHDSLSMNYSSYGHDIFPRRLLWIVDKWLMNGWMNKWTNIKNQPLNHV